MTRPRRSSIRESTPRTGEPTHPVPETLIVCIEELRALLESLAATADSVGTRSSLIDEKAQVAQEQKLFRDLRMDLLSGDYPPDLWAARFARYAQDYERRLRTRAALLDDGQSPSLNGIDLKRALRLATEIAHALDRRPIASVRASRRPAKSTSTASGSSSH